MFESFDNLPPDYVPNNMDPVRIREELIVENENVRRVFRNKRFVGYRWNYGENVVFDIDTNTTIKVAEGSIITGVSGAQPTVETVGVYGQRFYNITDIKSWLCGGLDGADYLWREDEYLTFDSDGTVEVTLTPDRTGKQLVIDIYNFRKEFIESFTADNTGVYQLVFDKEKSAQYIPGMYYMYICIEGEQDKTVISKLELEVDG